jgi:phosphoenolpyruvate carboxykinase (ATP)
MSINHTRALLNAALEGKLDGVECDTHPVFNLKIPKACPGVPSEVLDPRKTWKDPKAYDAAATKLRDMFRRNFEEKGFAKLGIKPGM